jgi:hypothetical protein
MILTPRSYCWLVAAFVLGATSTSAAQTVGNGVVIQPAPMHLEPDSARAPLTTVPAGTPVRVLARQGDWLWIVFRDPAIGDRVGYVRAAAVRVDSMPAGKVMPIRVDRLDRGYLWLSGTYQMTSTEFATFTRFGGTTAIRTTYGGVKPIVGDVALGLRVWNGLSIGLAGTGYGQITHADVSAIVPLPVPGAVPVSVSGRARDINRLELALHVDASWAVPIRQSRAQVVFFAGPSVFRVRQELVTGVFVNDTPPFVPITVVESTSQHVGANGGVEVSVRLYKALGLGGIVRYSRADVPFSPAPEVDVTVRAGGVQAGGGLHFRF